MIKQKGFTLIESIIYIALFSIIIGGGLVATYQIIQSVEASQNHVILQGEANFLFRKIQWALTGATAVDSPNTYTLNITKGSTLIFTKNGENLTLNGTTLNSSSIIVNLFSITKVTGSGARPDSVIVNFTLSTFQNGKVASQSFSMTKYLRK